jgi:hypothetical protein
LKKYPPTLGGAFVFVENTTNNEIRHVNPIDGNCWMGCSSTYFLKMSSVEKLYIYYSSDDVTPQCWWRVGYMFYPPHFFFLKFFLAKPQYTITDGPFTVEPAVFKQGCWNYVFYSFSSKTVGKHKIIYQSRGNTSTVFLNVFSEF